MLTKQEELSAAEFHEVQKREAAEAVAAAKAAYWKLEAEVNGPRRALDAAWADWCTKQKNFTKTFGG